MNIEIYGAEFLVKENEDSRRKVYPYVLSIFTGSSTITLYLEETEFENLKKEVKINK